MPFVSKAQRGYFNANRGKLSAQGVNVDEWNQASKGMKLPARKKHVVPHLKHGN
jgi:hypothetical protein